LVLHGERIGNAVAACDELGITPLFRTVAGSRPQGVLAAAEAKVFLALDWESEWDSGPIVDGGWERDGR